MRGTGAHVSWAAAGRTVPWAAEPAAGLTWQGSGAEREDFPDANSIGTAARASENEPAATPNWRWTSTCQQSDVAACFEEEAYAVAGLLRA